MCKIVLLRALGKIITYFCSNFIITLWVELKKHFDICECFYFTNKLSDTIFGRMIKDQM